MFQPDRSYNFCPKDCTSQGGLFISPSVFVFVVMYTEISIAFSDGITYNEIKQETRI